MGSSTSQPPSSSLTTTTATYQLTGGSSTGINSHGGDVILNIRQYGLTTRHVIIGCGVLATSAVITSGIVALKHQQRKRAAIERRAVLQRELESINLAGDLIGRVTLLDEIIQTVIHDPNRLYVIQGGAGTGKSAISVGLARVLRSRRCVSTNAQYNEIRLMHHYIIGNNANSRSKRATFINELIQACNDDRDLAPALQHTRRTAITDLLQLFTALRTLDRVASSKVVYLLVIDGCDESPAITSLLSSDTLAMMPSWCRIVVTTRAIPGRDWSMMNSSNTRVIVQQLDSSTHQLQAIAAYINHRLPIILRYQYNITDPYEQHDLCDSLITASGIFFVYARLAMDACERRDIIPSVTAFGSLPLADINGFYYESFIKRWPLTPAGNVPVSYATARRVLEDMITSQRFGDISVTLDELSEQGVDCSNDAIRGAINLLAPYLVTPSVATPNNDSKETKRSSFESLSSYEFIHHSFVEWLTSPANPYQIDMQHGHRRAIVSYMLRQSPAIYVVSSTPLWYRALSQWLGVTDFTWQPAIDNTGYGGTPHALVMLLAHVTSLGLSSSSASASSLNHTLSTLSSMIYALETERCRSDVTSSTNMMGHGYWSATDLTTAISIMATMTSSSSTTVAAASTSSGGSSATLMPVNRLIQLVWLTVLPERFIGSVSKAAKGLAPLNGSLVDGITHIDNVAVSSSRTIGDLFHQLDRTFTDDGAHVLTVIRTGARATTIRVRLFSMTTADLPSF